MGKTSDGSVAGRFKGRTCAWENCGTNGTPAAVVIRWPAADYVTPGALAPYCDAHGMTAEASGGKIIERIEVEEAAQ